MPSGTTSAACSVAQCPRSAGATKPPGPTRCLRLSPCLFPPLGHVSVCSFTAKAGTCRCRRGQGSRLQAGAWQGSTQGEGRQVSLVRRAMRRGVGGRPRCATTPPHTEKWDRGVDKRRTNERHSVAGREPGQKCRRLAGGDAGGKPRCGGAILEAGGAPSGCACVAGGGGSGSRGRARMLDEMGGVAKKGPMK